MVGWLVGWWVGGWVGCLVACLLACLWDGVVGWVGVVCCGVDSAMSATVLPDLAVAN